MIFVTVLLLLLVAVAILYFKDIRRQLLTISLFSALPYIAISLLFPGLLTNFSISNIWPILLQFAVTAFLAVGGYATYHQRVRHLTTPAVNPDRHQLIYLIGVVVYLILLVALGVPVLSALGTGAVIYIIVAILMRRHLIWETLFSGFGLGLLFIAAAVIGRYLSPSLFDDLWQSRNILGLSLLALPFEQITVLLLLGFLAGPIFLAIKDPHNPSTQPFVKQHIHLKAVTGLPLLLLVVATVAYLAFSYSFKAQVVVANYQAEKIAPLNSEIRLEFSRPVDRAAIKLSITPFVEGEWRFEDTLLGSRWFNTLVFQPNEIFLPGETYAIVAEDMRSMLRQQAEAYTHTFTTEPPPQVSRSVPAEGTTDYEICQPVIVGFNEAISDYWQPEFIFEPTVTAEIIKNAGEYTLKPHDCLAQGTAYTVTVTSRVANSLQQTQSPLAMLHFTTKPAPGIASYSPKGEAVVVSTNTIEIVLTKEMKPDDPVPYVSISPALAGTWSWQDNGTKLRYALSQTLTHGTKYSVIIKKGLSEASGNGFLEETSISFTTIGPVRINSVTPPDRSGSVHESVQPSIQFSQNVDHVSAEEQFSIEPAHGVSFGWSGNRLTIKPNSNFAYETTYTIRIKAGVKSAQGGLDLAQDFAAQFTTRFAPPVPITFGYSEQGRTISGYIFGNGGDVILLFGAIHGGKEPSSARLLDRLVGELGTDPRRVSGGKTVIIIPITNPDGYFERKDKQNSRGVNLNRNFATSNWNEAGWDTEGSIGSEPFSESESRVIRSVVQRYGVRTMFAFHSQGNLINPELGHASSQALARSYANLSRYHYYEDIAWNFPGTATRWFVETVGGPAVTVELASHSVADWSRHQKALFTVIQ